MTDPSIVLDLIDAFRRSKCMFTAVSMGLFDYTPAPLSELTKRTRADQDALERLLDGCVSLGLMTRSGDLFTNTEPADAYLRRDSPATMTGYILYSDRVLYYLWGNLEHAVKEGTHRWKQTFDLDGALFSHFFRTPEAKYEFLLGMHGFGLLGSPRVVRAFNLGGFRRLVDLGGATGHLPNAALERYPRLEAAVFDLPPVIETARSFADPRVELIPGDFFTDPLPPADLYALGRILHDWSEPKIRTLLRKVYEALPPGGGLLVIERLLDADRSGPASGLMQSLNMLCCTEGKERTLAEYEALLLEAGFASVEGRVTGAPIDAILARKAGTHND